MHFQGIRPKRVTALLARLAVATPLLLGVFGFAAAWPGQGSQSTVKPGHTWVNQEGNPLPFKTDEEVREFLRAAEVVSMKEVPVGVTRPRQVVLEKDGLRSRAIFRDVEETKESAMAAGRRERNFRDSYIFECAAYELAQMLGLDNIPPVVERNVNGRPGSVQIWLEGAMTEKDRQERGQRSPNIIGWNKQMQTVSVFDNLIANSDRNQGNLLIDKDWKLWMVDHTRAFLKRDDLISPAKLYQCERGLWEKLRALDDKEMERRLKPFLKPLEIDTLQKRRKKLVTYFQEQIAKRGESDVLYDY